MNELFKEFNNSVSHSVVLPQLVYRLSVYLSLSLSVCPSVFLFPCLSVCLSTYCLSNISD